MDDVPRIGAWHLNRECATAPARDSARLGVDGSSPRVSAYEFGSSSEAHLLHC